MAPRVPCKDDPINIVGAGIFGLSTALHLAARGYRNVTVFDKQPYDQTLYSYFNGCDAASADINKIIRSAYGTQTEYQELTFEAIEEWKSWNEQIASDHCVPPGMSTSDRVFIPCGSLSTANGESLHPFEEATIASMEAAGHRDTQLITTDARHQHIAEERGLGSAMDPFRRKQRGKSNLGLLDSKGGMAVADKACRFAQHKARSFGVRFVLDPVKGGLESIYYDHASSKRVAGIKTRDGAVHPAALTVLACGGWTPSILPALDGLCETTAGSVVILKIPQKSALFDRFSPVNFPTWMHKIRDGAEGGLYGFPRDEQGYLKIGYRGTKYTNPTVQSDGCQRSTPVTRWSSVDGQRKEAKDSIRAIPSHALNVITRFLDEYLPELREEGICIHLTRLCWYTDSFDNHFVIDHVPENEGLFVATGGSGHAFKYLPNIGNWVVDILEGIGLDRPVIQAWRWRQLEQDHTPYNVLMEGRAGSRALQNVSLVTDADLGLGQRAKL